MNYCKSRATIPILSSSTELNWANSLLSMNEMNGFTVSIQNTVLGSARHLFYPVLLSASWWNGQKSHSCIPVYKAALLTYLKGSGLSFGAIFQLDTLSFRTGSLPPCSARRSRKCGRCSAPCKIWLFIKRNEPLILLLRPPFFIAQVLFNGHIYAR